MDSTRPTRTVKHVFPAPGADCLARAAGMSLAKIATADDCLLDMLTDATTAVARLAGALELAKVQARTKARTIADGLADDFEDTADPAAEWPAWTDDRRWTISDQADELTPVSVLAESWDLPPIRGGAPQLAEPTDADWDDYFAHRDREDADERDHNERGGRFTERDARAAGLPI